MKCVFGLLATTSAVRRDAKQFGLQQPKMICIGAIALLSLSAIPSAWGTPNLWADAEESAVPAMNSSATAVSDVNTDGESPTTSPPSSGVSHLLSKAHRHVSNSISIVSRDIDSFFSREQFLEEATRSSVKLSYRVDFEDRQSPQYNFGFNARLILPRTENKFKLLLQSTEDSLFSGSENPSDLDTSSNNQVRKNRNLFLGLRRLLFQSQNWHVNLDGGVKLVWPPDPFLRLRVRREVHLDPWVLRIVEQVFWFDSIGYGHAAAIDLYRTIFQETLLQLGNNGDYLDTEGMWRFSHAVGLYTKLTERAGGGVSVGITSIEDPSLHLTSYFVAFSHRLRVLDDWLFLQTSPKLTWPKDDAFVFTPSITFKLEGTFGAI